MRPVSTGWRGRSRRPHTALGRTIDVAVPGGRQRLAVVGILRDTGAGRFDGGRVAYLPIEVAARLSGREGAVSRVDVDLTSGVDASRWVDAHRGAAAGRSSAWIAGIIMVALAGVLALAARGGDGGAAAGGDVPAVLLALFGAVLLVPLVLGPAARVLGRATGRLGRGMGPISVMHLVRERSRSAYTLGLVMVVFAAVFGIGAANASRPSSSRPSCCRCHSRSWSPTC